MSSFACIITEEWQNSKELENSLIHLTEEHIATLKEEKRNVRKQLEKEILRLEKEIQIASDILANH